MKNESAVKNMSIIFNTREKCMYTVKIGYNMRISITHIMDGTTTANPFCKLSIAGAVTINGQIIIGHMFY